MNNMKKIANKVNKDTSDFKQSSKDIGTCIRYNEKQQQINRSKFKTYEDAKTQFDKLLKLQVVNLLYIIYKCNICKCWHFGNENEKL
jgi:hypothetical protein